MRLVIATTLPGAQMVTAQMVTLPESIGGDLWTSRLLNVQHDKPQHSPSSQLTEFTPLDAESPDGPVSTSEAKSSPTILEQMGGVSGLVYSTLPIVAFVPANIAWGLKWAIVAALSVAGLILLWRLLRREAIMPAVSGFFGVLICAFIAHRTGSARGYFLYGIWVTAIMGIACVVSVLIRWPAVGVVWHSINGHGQSWRRSKPLLYVYDGLTLLWALVFGARYLVQSRLYDANHATALGIVRVAMGWPLTALVVIASVVVVAWVNRRYGLTGDRAEQ